MRNSIHGGHNQGTFSKNPGNSFPNFEKVQERPPIPTPASYAPVVITKCGIPLLNKFTHETEN